MRGRAMRLLGWTALMFALVGAPTALGAQEPQRRGGGRVGPPQDRVQLERRVRQRFAQMIRTQLELTDEQAAELGEVMEPFQEERLQLMRQDQGLRRRVEAVLIEGSVVDEEAEDLLGRMVELRERELLIFTREQQALRRVLTPSQILQFQVMREQLNERVRALGQQQGARRPPRGGGGGMEPAAGGRGQVHSMWRLDPTVPGFGR